MNQNQLRRGTVKPLTFSDLADRQLVWAFGSLNPGIAAFPHCIFENTVHALKECCSVVGALAAPWEIQVPFEANGEPFVRDAYTPEMLHLWETPQNQAQLPTMMNADLEFPLLVAVRTPLSVLQTIWSHPVKDYYSYIEHIPTWIESLAWAYIPLEYENEFAVFVVGNSQFGWVEEIKRRLASQQKTVFSLSPGNGRFHWKGPHHV